MDITKNTTNIFYQNELLTTLESDKEATLHCENKIMFGDIVVTSPKLVSETIIPSEKQQELTPSDSFAGYSHVYIEPIPKDYIIPEGNITITNNVENLDITKKKTLTVAVANSDNNNVTNGIYSFNNILVPTNDLDLSQSVDPENPPSDREILICGKIEDKICYLRPVLVTNEYIPDYWTLMVMSGSTIDNVSNVIYSANNSGEITTDELTGKVIELMTPGFFSEWILTNTTPVRSSTEMNIAFGDTAPEDTSKLWIKTAKPAAVKVKLNADFVGNEKISVGIGKLSAAVNRSGVTVIGDKIYVIGGERGSSSYTKVIQVFDTITGITTSTSILSNGTGGPAVEAVGNNIYIFGGYYYETSYQSGYLSSIYKYSTLTGIISSAVSLPKATQDMASAVVGKNIYLFGGTYYASSKTQYSRAIYVYNSDANTIQTLSATLPAGATYLAAVAVDTKIYLFGGYYAVDTIGYYLDTISVFDTENNTIRNLDVKLHTPLSRMTAAAIGTKIYLFGGYYYIGNTGYYQDAVCVFDTLNETIKTLDNTLLPAHSLHSGAAAVNNKIYLLGGKTSTISDPVVDINSLIVQIELPKNHILIEASGSKNIFNLLPDMEIGIKNVYLGNADGLGERVPAALYKDGEWVEI